MAVKYVKTIEKAREEAKKLRKKYRYVMYRRVTRKGKSMYSIYYYN